MQEGRIVEGWREWEVDRRRGTERAKRSLGQSRVEDEEGKKEADATHDGLTARDPVLYPLDLDDSLLVVEHVREENHLDGTRTLRVPALERFQESERCSRISESDRVDGGAKVEVELGKK